MSQCNLLPAAWLITRERPRTVVVVLLECSACLKPVSDKPYCSEICAIRDAEWFKLRVYVWREDEGADFETIGARLGITAKQARREYRVAMRKLKTGFEKIGIRDAEAPALAASMMARMQEMGDLH